MGLSHLAGFDAVGDFELAQQIGHVDAGRLLADEEHLGDLAVGPTGGELAQDLGLPRMSGIEVTREVKTRWPGIEVLVFTVFDEEEKVIQAVKAGASGYLLKGASASKVIEAIREVHAGGSVIQPTLARRLLRHFHVPEDPKAEPPGPPLREEPPTRPLTPREIEILRLIAKGLSNNEAAHVLDLSRATVRTHLEHIYEKLEVTNRVEAGKVGQAHRLG